MQWKGLILDCFFMKELFLAYKGHCGGLHPQTALALKVEQLDVAYPRGGQTALREISLEIGIGERVALVGPNGAGKSTLLLAIAGLLPASGGKIILYGHEPGACQHQVAYLPQRSDLDWSFPISVEKLVLTGRYVHIGWLKRPGPEDRERAGAALRLLRLDRLAHRQIGELSGGEQQRTLLARALAHEADLFLLDEPLNAVDAETRKIVDEVLEDLREKKKTVIMATHDLGRLEADFDQAVYLNEGRKVATPPGAPDGTAHCHA